MTFHLSLMWFSLVQSCLTLQVSNRILLGSKLRSYELKVIKNLANAVQPATFILEKRKSLVIRAQIKFGDYKQPRSFAQATLITIKLINGLSTATSEC